MNLIDVINFIYSESWLVDIRKHLAYTIRSFKLSEI